MASHHRSDLTALHRPSLSEDNEHLAFISSNQNLWVVSLNTGYIVQQVILPKAIKAILPQLKILKWAPDKWMADCAQLESGSKVFQKWLLLAGGNKLVVLDLNLPSQQDKATFPISTDAHIVADYQFESHNGNIATADFAFDHGQALVTFDMNIHASLVYFTKPHRDDIPCPKFQDHQGIAKASGSPYFAMLLRSKTRDQIAVFNFKSSAVENVSTFLLETTDAQGLLWSPNDDPVLIVWESATYGTAIYFFTALGHPLKQLDTRPDCLVAKSDLKGLSSIGITCLSWSSLDHKNTLLAIGCGGPCLIIQSQDHKSMSVAAVVRHEYNTVIDGSYCIIWQQTDRHTFENQQAVFELQFDHTSEINMIEISLNGNAIATKLNSLPKVVWIWNNQHTYPSAIIQFQHDIKQILWHPRVPDVLAITTSEKTPFIYIFHNFTQPPLRVVVPFEEVVLTSKWIAQWVRVSFSARCPVLISSKTQFDIGLLNHSDAEIVFESLLRAHTSVVASEEDSTLLETPSKTSKSSHQVMDWDCGDATGKWDATSDLDKW